MVESNAVPGFLPSTHGLHFANRFTPGPTLTRVVTLGAGSIGTLPKRLLEALAHREATI